MTRGYPDEAERAIVGFELDENGDWVAMLECGHHQHVRHQPPWQERPWVLTAEGRAGRVGTPLACLECDTVNGTDGAREEAGGEPACLADQVCGECGAVVDERGHRLGCEAGRAAATERRT